MNNNLLLNRVSKSSFKGNIFDVCMTAKTNIKVMFIIFFTARAFVWENAYTPEVRCTMIAKNFLKLAVTEYLC